MKKLWLMTKICVKAIGDLFDFLEPFAIALDEPIAWVLTVASVAMGVISLLTMGGMASALSGIAWFFVGYAMCPAFGIGSFWKAVACSVAVLMLTVLEKLAV
jgi:hypothetical protein